MIKVLIVDDSLVQKELLTYIIGTDPQFNVIGVAADGEEATRKVAQLKPDVVTMDINMPKMNGIDAIKMIMSTTPVPIVVISGSGTQTEVANSIAAMEAGAVWVVENTTFSAGNPKSLLNAIKLMSEVKVIKRHAHLYTAKTPNIKADVPIIPKVDVIGIGASTGGPVALLNIFKNLKDDFPPILVVQHISNGFLQGLSDWLAQSTKATIKIAALNEKINTNTIYFAPENHHMGINAALKITLSPDPQQYGHCPSATYLFHSIANSIGPNTLGILLTGMGRDGADGLKALKEKGGMTIVQDEASSLVYGMPKEAIALNAATAVLPPLEIAQYINSLKNKS